MSEADRAWLAARCAEAGAVAGTVHRLRGEALRLTAAQAIPAAVIEAVRAIPPGKGMAGLAWQRAAPVTTCDLEADDSGDVQPGARAVQAGQAAALPVFGPGDEVIAVVGFAFRDTGALSPETLARLTALAAALPAASE